MIRLTLILSGRPYEEHEFKIFQRLRIGRSEDCEVRIDNPGISRFQCEILNLGGTFQLRALSKSQPTFVNGSRVNHCTLADGDGISFGKFVVAFDCDQAFKTIARSGTGDAGFGEKTIGDEESADKARRESLSKVRGYLRLGPEDQHVLQNCFFTLGKDEDCDLILDGWGTPRLAAIIVRDEAGFRILDLSPKCDSVIVNGKLRRFGKLSHEDEIEVRGKTLTFFSGAPE